MGDGDGESEDTTGASASVRSVLDKIAGEKEGVLPTSTQIDQCDSCELATLSKHCTEDHQHEDSRPEVNATQLNALYRQYSTWFNIGSQPFSNFKFQGVATVLATRSRR